MKYAWLIVFMSLFIPGAAYAQLSGAGQGNNNNGALSKLLPAEVVFLAAYPPDNSIIAGIRTSGYNIASNIPDAPPSTPSILVKAEWLEIQRPASGGSVSKFQSIETPNTWVALNKKTELKVNGGKQIVSYPIEISLRPGGLITMTLYDPGKSSTVLYKIEAKDLIKSGDTVVVSTAWGGMSHVGSTETYIQLTFTTK